MNDITSDTIRRYFELAEQPDPETYFSQFAVDAVVDDEGTRRHGIDEIRAWRTEVLPVTYQVTSVAAEGFGHRAVATIAGDFPGSPVALQFDFQVGDDGLIRHLAIHP